jgi:methyl halide transferase
MSSLKEIQKFFAESDLPANDKWDTLWQDQKTPWDRGMASPALVELLLDKHFPLVPAGKPAKVLVPGCGRGYDVVLFAGLTAEDQKLDKAVGLDVSSKAVEEARVFHKDAPGQSEFVQGDFFSETEEWALAAPYDVVYDYTVWISLLQADQIVSLCFNT